MKEEKNPRINRFKAVSSRVGEIHLQRLWRVKVKEQALAKAKKQGVRYLKIFKVIDFKCYQHTHTHNYVKVWRC